MTTDKDYWNDKFRNRQNKLLGPEEYLVKNIKLLRSGSVLDVACGDGRNAIYLGRLGFDVTGVDFAEEGLSRLKRFASDEDLNLKTQVMDTGDTSCLAGLGQFDNAVLIHFKPSLETFMTVSDIIRPMGILLMTSFNHRHLQKTPQFPAELCYEEGEFLNRSSSLELVEYVSYADDRGLLDGYIFQKKSAC